MFYFRNKTTSCEINSEKLREIIHLMQEETFHIISSSSSSKFLYPTSLKIKKFVSENSVHKK